ncbi:MAG TPA: ACT domain-containing protein [Nitrospiria bacterium]
MNAFALITAAGPDRPGIVERLSRVLFETGCNIEDTSMTLLRGEFSTILIVRLPRGLSTAALEGRFAGVRRALGLSLMIKPLSAREVRRDRAGDGRAFILSVYGSDHPGIVHRVARVIAARSINVTDMNTRVIGPKKKPIYVMVMEVRVPPRVSIEALRRELRRLQKSLKVDISLNPVEAAPF